MIIGVPKESYPGDRRVAIVPVVVPTLTKAGFEVHIEAGAGSEAGYPDSQYVEKGAKIVADRARCLPLTLSCRFFATGRTT